MMRLETMFAAKQREGSAALMPFFTAGYPDMDKFGELLAMARDCGAAALEIGFPFSDPLADGPSIQLSSQLALAGGVNSRLVFDLLEDLAPTLGLPLIAMSYVNPLLAYGPERFARDAVHAGFTAIIVPDLPLGQDPALEGALDRGGLALVPLIAPSTGQRRLRRIADLSLAAPFAYLVSVAGVTGARSELPDYLPQFISRVRNELDLPLCLGFGVAAAGQAALLAGLVDGVIIGSAIADQIRASADDNKEVMRNCGDLLRSIDGALKGARMASRPQECAR